MKSYEQFDLMKKYLYNSYISFHCHNQCQVPTASNSIFKFWTLSPIHARSPLENGLLALVIVLYICKTPPLKNVWQTKARFTSIEWPGISYFDRDLKGPIRFPHYAFEFANPGISKPDYTRHSVWHLIVWKKDSFAILYISRFTFRGPYS